MNLITLLISAFIQHKARQQTDSLKEAGYRAAEKGRQVAFAGLFAVLAAGFFFSGVLIAIIELGLQIDRANGLSYSGLMISSTILVGVALVSLFCSWFSIKTAEQVTPEPPPQSHKSELVTLLENIALSFVRDFQNSQARTQSRDV